MNILHLINILYLHASSYTDLRNHLQETLRNYYTIESGFTSITSAKSIFNEFCASKSLMYAKLSQEENIVELANFLRNYVEEITIKNFEKVEFYTINISRIEGYMQGIHEGPISKDQMIEVVHTLIEIHKSIKKALKDIIDSVKRFNKEVNNYKLKQYASLCDNCGEIERIVITCCNNLLQSSRKALKCLARETNCAEIRKLIKSELEISKGELKAQGCCIKWQ